MEVISYALFSAAYNQSVEADLPYETHVILSELHRARCRNRLIHIARCLKRVWCRLLAKLLFGTDTENETPLSDLWKNVSRFPGVVSEGRDRLTAAYEVLNQSSCCESKRAVKLVCRKTGDDANVSSNAPEVGGIGLDIRSAYRAQRYKCAQTPSIVLTRVVPSVIKGCGKRWSKIWFRVQLGLPESIWVCLCCTISW